MVPETLLYVPYVKVKVEHLVLVLNNPVAFNEELAYSVPGIVICLLFKVMC